MSFNSGLFGPRSIETKKLAVWNKGAAIPGYDPTVLRLDAKGNVIRYADYGNRNAQYGWEMDHFPVPASMGGTDDLSNLRPLHCTANASHGGILGSLFKS